MSAVLTPPKEWINKRAGVWETDCGRYRAKRISPGLWGLEVEECPSGEGWFFAGGGFQRARELALLNWRFWRECGGDYAAYAAAYGEE